MAVWAWHKGLKAEASNNYIICTVYYYSDHAIKLVTGGNWPDMFLVDS